MRHVVVWSHWEVATVNCSAAVNESLEFNHAWGPFILVYEVWYHRQKAWEIQKIALQSLVQACGVLLSFISSLFSSSLKFKKKPGNQNRPTTNWSVFDLWSLLFILSQPVIIVIIILPYYTKWLLEVIGHLVFHNSLSYFHSILFSPNQFFCIMGWWIATISAICSGIKSILFCEPSQRHLIERSAWMEKNNFDAYK